MSGATRGGDIQVKGKGGWGGLCGERYVRHPRTWTLNASRSWRARRGRRVRARAAAVVFVSHCVQEERTEMNARAGKGECVDGTAHGPGACVLHCPTPSGPHRAARDNMGGDSGGLGLDSCPCVLVPIVLSALQFYNNLYFSVLSGPPVCSLARAGGPSARKPRSRCLLVHRHNRSSVLRSPPPPRADDLCASFNLR